VWVSRERYVITADTPIEPLNVEYGESDMSDTTPRRGLESPI
jgi:hypothetical protein